MTELSEEQKRNLENDWGAAAPFSDYRIGDILRYRAGANTYSGTIIWVSAQSESSIEGHADLALRYIVERSGWSGFPDVVYSSDILSQEPEEPVLVLCPYCLGHHYRGQVEYCPRNPNRIA